jgi:hypothetical protein
MAVVAATLVFTQFAASPARAIGFHSSHATASPARSMNEARGVSIAASMAKVPAQSPATSKLTHLTSGVSGFTRVRMESSVVRERFQCDENASSFFRRFVSILRDSVDPLVVLPGTPPPVRAG